jgi:hypothetical protein
MSDIAQSPLRRKLRFECIDDAIAEAERLVAAEREGRLRQGGSWSLGQALGHLSTWASFAFDGYPPEVHAPLPVRLVLRVLRRRILTKGMMSGVRIRGIPGGTLGTEPIESAKALEMCRQAFQRIANSCPINVNPAFGRLSHEQWIMLSLRHAELHLGFLHPQ